MIHNFIVTLFAVAPVLVPVAIVTAVVLVLVAWHDRHPCPSCNHNPQRF